ncbi:MAG: aminopeptidase [Anaerolineae bacterium]|jgi:aminopeptidase|nr:aminopeptidase [Anaerolineae bacterium]MBT7072499.1 aminopeptidase [Anaerolineae bacterium]MBT7325722.1 aminopeptidase [Anaerolineae bacterium]
MNIPQDIREGAQVAVQTCMNIRAKDCVYIISDEETFSIGQALEAEALATDAKVKLIKMEDFGTRPFTEMPEGFMEAIFDFDPTVTIYAAGAQRGELTFRMGITAQMIKKGIKFRHGHMVSITEQLMREGMRADYQQIHDLTMRVHEIVKKAKTITFTSKKGSDVTARFAPDLKWIPCHGLYHNPGDWGNLPEGEVFTCPETVNGTIVADILGDYFSPKYGVLDTPVTFEVKDGWVEKVHCENKQIEDELWAYLNSNENGRRIGEFAIGTNTALTKLSGVLLQDEKIPGIHIAFGDPGGRTTGADWSATTHIDVIPTDCTIAVDGEVLMQDGAFVFDL